MSKSNILFQLTGSIACYKACYLISKLVQQGFNVKVVATPSALKFIGKTTLEGLSGQPVYTELFDEGQAMSHIHLDRWADLIITAPATANYLNKISSGIGDDLISTLFLAHDFKKPFLIAPAMNVSMYQHPTTAASLQKLRQMGLQILEPEQGTLACGEVGEGKLLDPDKIFLHIKNSLGLITKNPVEKKIARVLITSGGTVVPIDNVRNLTNLSTGETGALIAEELATAGAEVTYLHGKGAKLPRQNGRPNLQTFSFETFSELKQLLKAKLTEHFDYIVHCAAVSDFAIEKIDGKLKSDQEFVLKLTPNLKLIDQIKTWSANSQTKLIAFKLTSTTEAESRHQAVRKLFTTSMADLLIHNDTHEMESGQHLFHVYGDQNKIVSLQNKLELAQYLKNFIQENDL